MRGGSDTSDIMSKIFAILAVMVLVMSSVSLAQYGSPGDGDSDKPLEIEFESSCEQNVVTVYHKNTPNTVSGAQVTVTTSLGDEVFSGETDSNGQITFDSHPDYCGMSVIIYASKAGYIPDEETHDLISCEQCEEEEEEPTPPTTGGDEEDGTGDEGTTEFECDANVDCEDNEYCAIAVGAAGGDCMPVVGECGYAENHAWVSYECGDEAGCPSCDSGFECSDHVCMPVEEEPPEDDGAEPGDGEDETDTGEDEETGGDEGIPLWMWFVGGVVVIGLAALVYWLLMGQGAARGRR